MGFCLIAHPVLDGIAGAVPKIGVVSLAAGVGDLICDHTPLGIFNSLGNFGQALGDFKNDTKTGNIRLVYVGRPCKFRGPAYVLGRRGSVLGECLV